MLRNRTEMRAAIGAITFGAATMISSAGLAQVVYVDGQPQGQRIAVGSTARAGYANRAAYTGAQPRSSRQTYRDVYGSHRTDTQADYRIPPVNTLAVLRDDHADNLAAGDADDSDSSTNYRVYDPAGMTDGDPTHARVITKQSATTYGAGSGGFVVTSDPGWRIDPYFATRYNVYRPARNWNHYTYSSWDGYGYGHLYGSYGYPYGYGGWYGGGFGCDRPPSCNGGGGSSFMNGSRTGSYLHYNGGCGGFSLHVSF